MKKKIFIVPHTHWDREWYFTNTTSNILLQRLAKDLINYNTNKFVLDGQASLLYDIRKYSPKIAKKLEIQIKNKNLIIGPLYVQQDNFNVMAATTQLNMDIGKEITGKENMQKTMYMPDSFGFNEQLPQMFKMNGFKNFVFWRGIKPKDKNISNLFNWIGIDGTKIISSCMSNGYYTLGQYYPYNNEDNKVIDFEKQLIKQSKELMKKNDQEAYFLPLGGDQAPYEHNIANIIKKINKKQDEFEFLLGSYDDYFNIIKNNPVGEIKYSLNYSGTSKIHRTIHSNRVDIKILFRKCERLLHLGVLPLEIMFKSMGGDILSKKTLEKEVFSPLIKSSAHDSLGSCNSDITNTLVKNRLTKVKIFLESYIDLIVRDMNHIFGKENKVMIYNHLPFKRDIFDTIVISTNNDKSLTSQDGKIIEISKKDISWKQHDEIWHHKVQIYLKDVEPYSWKMISLDKNNNELDKNKSNNFIQVSNYGFKFLNSKISLLVETDDGDEFDFSEHREPIMSKIISNDIIENKTFDYQSIIKTKTQLEFKNKILIVNIIWTQINKQIYASIKIKNNLENVRVSLLLPKGLPTLSRHLAFIPQSTDDIKDWISQKYKDNPVNSYANDGLVMINNLSIFTRGNNEVVISKENNKIVLYRSVNFLGKPDLKDRPGVASGLPQKVSTPNALLKQEQEFNFSFSNSENIIEKLNNWNAYNIISFIGQKDSIIQKYDRFVINEIKTLNKPIIKKIDFNLKEELLAYIKLNNDKIEIMKSNPTKNKIKGYRPYEIKKTIL